MKKIINLLFVFVGCSIFFSCSKKTIEPVITDENLQHFNQMRIYYNLAVSYEDTLEKCQNSLLSNCNFNRHDSLFHYCFNQWEYHHNMYSHNNNVDDHSHSMMGDRHEHCNRCNDVEHHSIKDHHQKDSLLSIHRKHFH